MPGVSRGEGGVRALISWGVGPSTSGGCWGGVNCLALRAELGESGDPQDAPGQFVGAGHKGRDERVGGDGDQGTGGGRRRWRVGGWARRVKGRQEMWMEREVGGWVVGKWIDTAEMEGWTGRRWVAGERGEGTQEEMVVGEWEAGGVAGKWTSG